MSGYIPKKDEEFVLVRVDGNLSKREHLNDIFTCEHTNSVFLRCTSGDIAGEIRGEEILKRFKFRVDEAAEFYFKPYKKEL